MKISQDVRDYADQQGMENMDDMSKEFKEKGSEIYNKL